MFYVAVAIMVKTFGKRKKLLVSKPTIVATFPDSPHTNAHNYVQLPEKFATSKELEEIFNNEGPETIFMNIFYLQMYTDIPEFRKKVDEYNKKYPEDRIFFNE